MRESLFFRPEITISDISTEAMKNERTKPFDPVMYVTEAETQQMVEVLSQISNKIGEFMDYFLPLVMLYPERQDEFIARLKPSIRREVITTLVGVSRQQVRSCKHLTLCYWFLKPTKEEEGIVSRFLANYKEDLNAEIAQCRHHDKMASYQLDKMMQKKLLFPDDDMNTSDAEAIRISAYLNAIVSPEYTKGAFKDLAYMTVVYPEYKNRVETHSPEIWEDLREVLQEKEETELTDKFELASIARMAYADKVVIQDHAIRYILPLPTPLDEITPSLPIERNF